MVNRAALRIDSSSKWIVTARSILTGLINASGLSGSSVTNIVGYGKHVSYDASLTANIGLGPDSFPGERRRTHTAGRSRAARSGKYCPGLPKHGRFKQQREQ